jgi:hypothetical protein
MWTLYSNFRIFPATISARENSIYERLEHRRFHENSSSTQVWNDAVLLALERYEPNDMTVANDVPVPALDLSSN